MPGELSPVADDGGRTSFDFAKPEAGQAWLPANDGVIGGAMNEPSWG